MTPFLLSAAGLILIVYVFLLPPLWRGGRRAGEASRRQASNLAIFRDQLSELERARDADELGESEFQQGREELQRRVLEEAASDEDAAASARSQPSRKLALILSLLVPLLAVAAYLAIGTPRALDPVASMQPEKVTPEKILGMVETLAQRLKDSPDDAEGWLMLARSYKSMGRLAEAADAYEKAGTMVFDSPDLLTDYADLLATMNGGSLSGKPLELVNRALHLDPQHVLALWLAGTAAFNNKDFANAALIWERAVKVLPPDSEDARMLAEGISEARRRSEIKPNPQKTLGGRVSLAPSLKNSLAPGDTLFIFARATDGSRMPLAIARARASDLPFDFVLDDSSAMSAERVLSKQAEVLVVARISKSGNAVPRAGDLESPPQPAKPGERKLDIVIDRIVQ